MLRIVFILITVGFLIVGYIFKSDKLHRKGLDYILNMDLKTKAMLDNYNQRLLGGQDMNYSEQETKNDSAFFETGLYNLGKNNYAAAESQLKEAAAAGSIRAMDALGYMYNNAKVNGVQDMEEAALWYKKSAKFNSIAGNFYMCRYLSYLGDHKAAFSYCESSAEQGVPLSCALLGDMYFQGKGISKNKEKARSLICKANSMGRIMPYLEDRYEIICSEGTNAKY